MATKKTGRTGSAGNKSGKTAPSLGRRTGTPSIKIQMRNPTICFNGKKAGKVSKDAKSMG